MSRCHPPRHRRSSASTRRWARPLVASEKVRFAGDIVAIVLADSRETSVDAAELVEVEYEPLPAVTDIEEAAKDETLLFEDVGTNVCLQVPPRDPDQRCSTTATW